MTIKTPSVGETAILKDAFGVTTPGGLTFKLFVNDVTPGDNDTAGTYTEMSTNGYAAKVIAAGTWTVVQSSGAAAATASNQVWTFTASGSATVYGYYVVGDDGVLRWAERLAAPFLVQANGDSLTLSPKFTLYGA